MALPNYKDIVELIKKGSTLEAQEIIMKQRETEIELREENINLKGENKKLKDKLYLSKVLKFDGLVYWKEKGSEKEGAFCPTCFDSNEKLIHLHKQTDGWFCNVCQNGFYTKSETDTNIDLEYKY